MSSASMDSVTKQQPAPTAPPTLTTTSVTADAAATAQPNGASSFIKDKANWLRWKFTTREGWFGDYDYRWMCMPTLPISTKSSNVKRLPPFYGLNDELPLFLALSCGLQHALAMLGGLITPPIIFASSLNLDPEMRAYMISASLIGCGESLSNVFSLLFVY